MDSAVCAADVTLPVDDAEHLRDRSRVSANGAARVKVDTANLPRSFQRRHSPEFRATASVSFDWLVGPRPEVHNPHGAFLATGRPVRRQWVGSHNGGTLSPEYLARCGTSIHEQWLILDPVGPTLRFRVRQFGECSGKEPSAGIEERLFCGGNVEANGVDE